MRKMMKFVKRGHSRTHPAHKERGGLWLQRTRSLLISLRPCVICPVCRGFMENRTSWCWSPNITFFWREGSTISRIVCRGTAWLKPCRCSMREKVSMRRERMASARGSCTCPTGWLVAMSQPRLSSAHSAPPSRLRLRLRSGAPRTQLSPRKMSSRSGPSASAPHL